MFTNATILELYARARRDEDLLPRRSRAATRRGRGLGDLLRRLIGSRPATPAPAPVPVPAQPR